MASNDVASELEKGIAEFSPVSDGNFKERPSDSTDAGTTVTEKAGYYTRCTLSTSPDLRCSIDSDQKPVKYKIAKAILLLKSGRTPRKDDPTLKVHGRLSETKVRRRKPTHEFPPTNSEGNPIDRSSPGLPHRIPPNLSLPGQ